MAAFSVATLSATVCVVQSRANRDGAVSRLQWNRASPAAFSFARSASPTSPNDPQQMRDVSARIRRIASQIASTSAAESARPDVTSPKRTTPFASASFAAATHASTDFSPHASHAVFQCADCAHHLQFSEHFPQRAFRIAQKSKTSALNASVTRCAASKRSSFAAVSRSRRTSSGVASPPATIRSARAWAGFPSFAIVFLFLSYGCASAHPAKP